MGPTLGEFFPFAEFQSVYSAIPTDWASEYWNSDLLLDETKGELFGPVKSMYTFRKLKFTNQEIPSLQLRSIMAVFLRITKAWTAIDKLSIIWKSDMTDKRKRSFFQAAVVSILLYGCTTWTLTKRLEEKLDGNYTRMLQAILNKSWRQHPTRHQLYGHLLPITKTIQVRRTRHAGHCWRSRDELISDVLLWTPTYDCSKAERPARTYIQQLCEDTGCRPEDLPESMNDREKWRERIRDIRASGTTWWWWWWCFGYVSLLLSQVSSWEQRVS